MKFKIFIILSLAVSLLTFSVVNADSYGLDATQKVVGSALPTNIKGATNLPELVGVVINVGLSLIGIFFFALMLYAGVTWMKSFGNSDDVNRAKEMITQAIIGLIIVMAAYAISNFVFSSLGAGGGGGPSSGGGNTNPVPASSGEAIVVYKDGDTCTISNENWSNGTVTLSGQSGLWNCQKNKGQQCDPGVGECQPSCRYNNAGAKCQQAACAAGKETTKGNCPVGNCCLP